MKTKGLLSSMGVATLTALVAATGCATTTDDGEETGQANEELRAQCSVQKLDDEGRLNLSFDRWPGDRFACVIGATALMRPPNECAREYSEVLFNGDATHILSKDECTNCSRRPGDAYLLATEGYVVMPRGHTYCRIARFDDVYSQPVVKRICFTCPVECSAPDHC